MNKNACTKVESENVPKVNKKKKILGNIYGLL